MEQKITDILHIIKEEGSDLSQRELAKRAGFSLGNVNILLKKCVHKGLLKVKKINPRKVKYILTPEGLKVVYKKTLHYVQNSYQIISNLKKLLEKITQEKFPEKEICILKNQNQDYKEVWELVRGNLNNLGRNYKVYNSIDELKGNENMEDSVVLFWNTGFEDNVNELNIDSINIVNYLNIGK